MKNIKPNNIYLGDCLDIMNGIDDDSINLILCDLPYGILSRQNKYTKWDNIIPFEPLWNHYTRILKEDGVICLFGSGMFTAKLMISAPTGWWRYNLIWVKDLKTGFLDANRRPLRQHEDIIIFSKKGHSTYNPQMIKVGYHRRSNRSNNKSTTFCSCYGNGQIPNPPVVFSNEKFPTSVICFPKATNSGYNHPTEKPVNLLRYLIKTYSNEGDIVLDNTMGSGSTCVACIEEKRNYIGIEINQKYYDIAEKRIKEQNQQLKLNFD